MSDWHALSCTLPSVVFVQLLLPLLLISPLQIIAMIMNGIQMEVPAQDRLPGPDAAGFAGLDDYIALMR